MKSLGELLYDTFDESETHVYIDPIGRFNSVVIDTPGIDLEGVATRFLRKVAESGSKGETISEEGAAKFLRGKGYSVYPPHPPPSPPNAHSQYRAMVADFAQYYRGWKGGSDPELLLNEEERTKLKETAQKVAKAFKDG